MKIKLYNYLTRKKEVFKAIKNGVVGLYTCGPTIYDYVHIGNLRTYIFEDILRRTLETAGYNVKHVMNITDVDDKIIKKASNKNESIENFVKPYEEAFFRDTARLNIKLAWKYPKATMHIGEMVSLINTLLKKKIAYKTEDGVYFDISKFKKYGKLSQLKKREIKIGARVSSDEYEKGSAEDFVLWKAAKRGEPSWRAQFGAGRPGWHIECSAMSMKYLGMSFEIHAGGVDLLFPHHENEIAQSEAATKKRFAKYFIEGEHLLVDNKKMSKSLGNIYTLQDLKNKNISPLAFRYLTLGAHYRSQLNFTWESLEGAQRSLDRIYKFVGSLIYGHPTSQISKFRDLFQEAIFDDLNTPKALAAVWQLIGEYNKNPTKFKPEEVLSALYEFDKILGLDIKKMKFENGPPAEVLKLIKEREIARKAKNFTLSDEIRHKIVNLGWQVNDTKSGSQVFHL